MVDQRYELMFMIRGSEEDSKVPEIKQRVFTELKNFGGEMTSEYDMGRRKLAYWIGAERHGVYHVLQFTMEANQVPQFDAKMRLDQDVLRYIIVKNRPMTSQELQEMLEEPKEEDKAEESSVDGADDVAGALPTKEAPKAAAPKVEKEEVKEEVVEEAPKEEEAKEETTEEAATEEAAPANVKDLDKKLDAILDDTDIESQV